MAIVNLFVDVVVGIGAGLIAGLLGTGNSLVVLPALMFSFYKQYPVSIALLMAVATNLAICGVSIFFTTLFHHKHVKTDWNILKITAPAYFLASIIGPRVAHLLPVNILKILIIIFIFFAAVTLMLKEKPAKPNYLPSSYNLFASSFVITFLSSITGMATGVLFVPYLSWLRVDIKKAISIALPGAVIFSFTAMVGYIITGWGNPLLPKWSLGYVYLPSAVIISVFAAIFSVYGVRLHQKINISKLRKVFALLLIIAGCVALKI